jgi:hypothetical protein
MKKVNLACLFMLWLLLIFSNCKKEDEANNSGEVKLQVTKYGSNAPVKNAFVGLLKRTSNGVGSSASWEVLKDGKTDSLGYINFGNYNECNNLYIDVQHPDYYDISTISYEQVKNQQSRIVLNGMAYLKLVFVPDSLINYPLRAIWHNGAETNGSSPNPFAFASNGIAYRYCYLSANLKQKIVIRIYSDINNTSPESLLFESNLFTNETKLKDTSIINIKF